MKKWSFIYVLALLAYVLSLGHSVIPHHHHDSVTKIVAHNHGHNQNHDHHPSKQDSKKEKSENDHLLFLTHLGNVDVLVKQATFENPVKAKKEKFQTAPGEFSPFTLSLSHLVFHPPQDEPLIFPGHKNSKSLRAPPFNCA